MNSYNGIMLCKRPLPGETIIKKPSICRTTPMKLKEKSTNNFWKPPNSSTATETKKRQLGKKLNRNSGVLRKHKEWLKEMKEKRDEKSRIKEEEKRQKEEQKEQFMKRQAEKRQKAREIDQEDENIENEIEIEELKSNVGDKRSRPAWSLMEEDVQDLHEQEENELMEYVDDLDEDCDKYYDDMELRILMDQVKERIRVLEREKGADENKLKRVLESEIASARNEVYNLDTFIENIPKGGNDRTCIEGDEIQSIADSIKSEGNSSMLSIHSRNSLNALVAREKDKLSTKKIQSDTKLVSISESGETNLKLPSQIVHQEDNGRRIKETKSISKLPFKHRNPAL